MTKLKRILLSTERNYVLEEFTIVDLSKKLSQTAIGGRVNENCTSGTNKGCTNNQCDTTHQTNGGCSNAGCCAEE